MRVNYNIQAVITNNVLKNTESKLAASTERLSSGLKINAAKDNPSGLAIAKRMSAQLRGISVASQNATDGISVIQTAEGSLSEMQEMIKRISELSVKAATETLTDDDRDLIQQEVSQLKEEIERIAGNTDFNGQTLLNGSFDLKGYSSDKGVKVTTFSDSINPGNYEIEVETKVGISTPNVDTSKTFTAAEAGALTFSVKGYTGTINVSAGDSVQDVLDQINDSVSTWYDGQVSSGSINGIEDITSGIEFDWGTNEALGKKMGMTADAEGGTTTKLPLEQIAVGKITASDASGGASFVAGATSKSNGTSITFYDRTGKEITVKVDPEKLTKDANGIGKVSLELTDIGPMIFQIGANEGQTLAVRIPTISLENLGLEKADVSTVEGAEATSKMALNADAYISSVRSRLGAYQNRLEHTSNSLEVTNENITAAYSGIMDVDMAKEMTEYSKYQILSQAGTSMLAQANERPQQILQLLQ